MKKVGLLFLSIILITSGGCFFSGEDDQVLKVGATPVPHGEILEEIKPLLEEQGIKIEIVEFTDYIQPNLQLGDEEIDANFFQHIPYLNAFSEDHNLDLTYISRVHIEPMGIYSHSINNLSDLVSGAKVAIPNDVTNGGRALLLLERSGLIKLGKQELPDLGDITENPKNLSFIELEAATLPRTLEDVSIGVINTNFALEAGLDPINDPLFIEDSTSPYVNVLAVRKEDKKREDLLKLAKALNHERVREFLRDKYGQAIVPAF